MLGNLLDTHVLGLHTFAKKGAPLHLFSLMSDDRGGRKTIFHFFESNLDGQTGQFHRGIPN